MRALTFHGPGDVRCERVDDPELVEPGDAIVRVAATAICGSDLHVWHGRETGLDAGTVMGHEFLGEVVEVGDEAAPLRPGVRVHAPFTTSCGSCFHCRAGLTSRCERGALFGWVEGGRGLHGGQAEYVRVPLAATTLRPVPADLGDEEALLLGDVLSTGWFCAERGDVGPGTTCVVLGCGPVGLCAVLAALELGAARVLAVDSVAERLARARALGADGLTPGEAPAAVTEATHGRGADAVLEAVGSEAAHSAAWALVRPGGTISVVGVHTGAGFGFRPAQAYDRNLTYRVGRCPARALMGRLEPVARRHADTLRSLFSHRVGLAEGPEAYRLFDAKRDGCVKVLLAP